MGSLCCEAHAPRWLWRCLEAKQSSDSFAEARSMSPSTRTWTSMLGQWNASAACGLASSSDA